MAQAAPLLVTREELLPDSATAELVGDAAGSFYQQL